MKQFNDLEISPRSSTFVSAESRRLISSISSNFSFCGRILYNLRDIGRGRVNDLQISFKVIKSGTNRKPVRV